MTPATSFFHCRDRRKAGSFWQTSSPRNSPPRGFHDCAALTAIHYGSALTSSRMKAGLSDMDNNNTAVAVKATGKVYSSHGIWLLHALLCIGWWGLWGFLSKLGSDHISPQQLQILFTIGIIPTSALAWAQLGFKVETDRRGAIYGILNGVFSGLGMLAYYAALARGQASLV